MQQRFDIVGKQGLISLLLTKFTVDIGKQPEQLSIPIRDMQKGGQNKIRFQHQAVKLLAAAMIHLFLMVHICRVGDDSAPKGSYFLARGFYGSAAPDEQI